MRARRLRFLTCGSVDDGKSTLIGRLLYEQKLIFDDQLAALERDSKKHGTDGARDRFRAAARRPGSRARAGHHHRRRLPLFRDAAARLHRRRYAGPRAIYPQHGDRRVQRRPRRAAGRRAQGLAEPDAPPRHHREPARHPPRRAGGEQDRSGRFRSRACSTKSPRGFDGFAAALGFKDIDGDPDVGALRRQRIVAQRAHALVLRARICSSYLETVDVEDDRAGKPFRMPVQWVNRPQSPISAALPARSRAAPSSRATRSSVLPSGQTTQRQAHRRRRRRSRCRAGRRRRHRHARRRNRRRARRHAGARRATARRSPTSSPRIWSGWRPSRCCPGRSYLMKINNATLAATVTELKHRIDVDTLAKLAAKTLALNEVGVCNLSVAPADRLRSLRRQPRHRRLHPDRPLLPTRRSPPA